MVETFEHTRYILYRQVDHPPLSEGAFHKHSQRRMSPRERSYAIKECLYS